MHELSIAQSLLAIIREEMDKHELTKLRKVRVKHGKLAAIVPEALEFAFEACIANTPLEGAELEMECVPLKLKCSACGTLFSPEDPDTLFIPCPNCGEGIGHQVLQGKELYLDNMEAE
ncbi:hydrogenase maturation nickel metallochaperone HypA [Desulfobaculum bizertense]|uniref:Hydrogenase maturation factor HypA n=1 Tax=Desulfobaculum bizertense DSM 18034 TaxID=1121442 RepID=A0A1T4VV28_9BACT|nr:hydrogenase maturation nickel metallochaperone HypA [Desulfobaculum bizertense]UIJ38467.1 hydrogenase maturation nickel metallochaperone HypA [Desulfobaculum bizertense]SKA68361.1 hydrogenase nickel incorporation protein HypA/HybF [Desulfobaculum bizertense DSM 18034]